MREWPTLWFIFLLCCLHLAGTDILVEAEFDDLSGPSFNSPSSRYYRPYFEAIVEKLMHLKKDEPAYEELAKQMTIQAKEMIRVSSLPNEFLCINRKVFTFSSTMLSTFGDSTRRKQGDSITLR